MFNKNKRKFIFQLVSAMFIVTTGSINKLFASWQGSLFEHQSLNDSLNSLTGKTAVLDSEKITIKAPEIAENGAVVPVTVNSTIENIKRVAILVDNNPSPLTSTYEINPAIKAYVSTRVKIAESSNIIALVTTKDNRHYKATKNIKVTIGGCGG